MRDAYTKTKRIFWGTLSNISPSFHAFVFRCRQYLKYVFSGSSAAFANLVSLSILVELFHMYYLLASVLSFVLGFLVSFVLQKYFTFGNTTLESVHRQLAFFLVITVANLGFNTLAVYLFVEVVGIWYFAAQILAGILIALESFFLYRRFVFNHTLPPPRL